MSFTVEEALRNMLGAFDTPLVRIKLGKCWNGFIEEAVQSAREAVAVNNGNPLWVGNLPVGNLPHIFNVHTEHCCAKNGCKYGEEDSCPVWLGYVKQSYGYWDGDESHPIPEISTEVFEKRRAECSQIQDSTMSSKLNVMLVAATAIAAGSDIPYAPSLNFYGREYPKVRFASGRDNVKGAPKRIARNEPCPCGSGKKNKLCCKSNVRKSQTEKVVTNEPETIEI